MDRYEDKNETQTTQILIVNHTIQSFLDVRNNRRMTKQVSHSLHGKECGQLSDFETNVEKERNCGSAMRSESDPGSSKEKKMDIKTDNQVNKTAYLAIEKQLRETLTRIETKRKSMPSYQEKGPSQKTVKEYGRMAQILLMDTKTPEEVITKAKDTNSIRTWGKRRAALMHTFIHMARKLLDPEGEKRKRAVDEGAWIKQGNQLAYVTDMLNALDSTEPLEKEKRKPANSKRGQLRGLPDDWQEQILNRMPSYQLQIITLTLTACRPAELENGVLWKLIEGKLHATIQGVKISENSGQPVRELIYSIGPNMTERMAEILKKKDDSLIVKVDSKVNLTTAIRAAGMRTFPKHPKALTAYSFRHQAAADGKARAYLSDNPEEELLKISKWLGHLTDQTRGYYGHEKQSKGGSVVPDTVITSRAIKQMLKTNYASLSKRNTRATPRPSR